VLVVANLVPLLGAVLLGWNVGAIVVLYWFESVIVGILNVPKIALAKGGPATSALSKAISTILCKVVAGSPVWAVASFVAGKILLELRLAQSQRRRRVA
jgi:hypothetical protein